MKSKDKSLEAAFRYARSQTAHYSKSFFFSATFLPKEKRWETYALYGFCRYADNIIDNPRGRTTEELIEEVNSVIREIKIAYRLGESEHPIIKSFIHVAKKRNIPIEYPLELMEGVKMDLTRNRYNNFDELYQFAYRVAGVVGLMMSYVLGYKDESALVYAEQLGVAMQLTNILRDVKEDKEMNRIYLPLDELERFGLTEEDVLSEKMNVRMRRLMKFQVKRAHRYYHEADKGIKMLTPNTQFAIYSASRIYQGILMKIEARNYNPFLGRVFVKQSKKMLILFSEIWKSRIVRPAFNLLSW
ncbi:MAG: phytoene/squalene synthase family protein [Calditrichaceae bacterium]|nr:phytoene/squalene synthase family protein [Calditrichaceae bacterium]RQV92971.1 MAG: phytoene/squalene synthase family protein [Calditrichota bacterium]